MFKVNELLKATRGTLITPVREDSICGISIDSRTIKPRQAFIAIKGENFDGHDFINEAVKKGADCIIAEHNKLSTQYSILNTKRVTLIEVKDTIMALGDIASYCRQKFNIPVIGVTGSNGKTTTKDMIAHILSGKFKILKNSGTKNNQIGLPLTLTELKNFHQIVVLELGTNHPGEIEYLSRICQPNIGIITNIGPSHLEYLVSLKGVYEEKRSLIKYIKRPAIMILNADDKFLKKILFKKEKKSVSVGFGIKTKSDFFATDIRNFNGRIEFLVNRKFKFTIRSFANFNIYNALAAIVVSRIFGMEYKEIFLRLLTFKFPDSRLKLIESKNIRFLDDTYNSNPLSLKETLETLEKLKIKGRKIFVMGDMLELGSREKLFHRQAGRQAVSSCDVFITVGNLSKFAAYAAKVCGFDMRNLFTCETPTQAKNILLKRISPSPEDIVLVKGSRLMKMEEILKI